MGQRRGQGIIDVFEGVRKAIVTPNDDKNADGLQDGLIEVPVDGGIAIRANQLPGFHGDPAGRLIAATALEGHTLGISGRRTLAWPGWLNART